MTSLSKEINALRVYEHPNINGCLFFQFVLCIYYLMDATSSSIVSKEYHNNVLPSTCDKLLGKELSQVGVTLYTHITEAWKIF